MLQPIVEALGHVVDAGPDGIEVTARQGEGIEPVTDDGCVRKAVNGWGCARRDSLRRRRAPRWPGSARTLAAAPGGGRGRRGRAAHP